MHLSVSESLWDSNSVKESDLLVYIFSDTNVGGLYTLGARCKQIVTQSAGKCNSYHVKVLILYEPFPKQALVFTCLQYKSIENTAGKGEIARNEQFLLLPQCLLSFRTAFCHFNQFSNCRLQSLPI